MMACQISGEDACGRCAFHHGLTRAPRGSRILEGTSGRGSPGLQYQPPRAAFAPTGAPGSASLSVLAQGCGPASRRIPVA